MAASFYKWLLVAYTGLLHQFFVSVTEIRHNAKEQTLEVSCKLFLDDTEKALKKQLGIPVELTNPKDPRKAQQWLADYVKKHLQVKVDGKPVNLEFAGYEIEGASVWSYYQIQHIPSVHHIDVSNNLLYEMYDSQISIVHAQVGTDKKSSRVNYPETNLSFDFP